jgi:DNA-binding transcriptional ArsR family regulator
MRPAPDFPAQEPFTLTQQDVGRVADLLHVLGNRDRLHLLIELATEECCVSELSRWPHIVQLTLSQQLTVLRRAGLVITRRAGRYIHYRVADDRLRQWLISLPTLV